MKSIPPRRLHRWVSAALILLLLVSAGWSVSPDAFADWLRIEAAAAADFDGPMPSGALERAMKAQCNRGCHASTQFLAICASDLTVFLPPPTATIDFDQPRSMSSMLFAPPHPPPRPQTLGVQLPNPMTLSKDSR